MFISKRNNNEQHYPNSMSILYDVIPLSIIIFFVFERKMFFTAKISIQNALYKSKVQLFFNMSEGGNTKV